MYKYLLEIKYRSSFIVLTWLSLLEVCYCFKETILYIFVRSNINKCFYFLTTNITEIFDTYIQLIFFATNQISFLYIYYQIFVYISAGLFTIEYTLIKKLIKIIVIFKTVCFCVFNSYILPISWAFFFKFQNLQTKGLTFIFETKLNEYFLFYFYLYYIFITIIYLIIGFTLVFNLITKKLIQIKKLKKSMYLIFFIIATILTPPEISIQLTVGLIMITFYELVLFSYIFFKLATNYN